MAEVLLYDVKDGVATITLNRPDQRNALNGELLAGLVEALRSARDDEAVRAVVLTGAGEKVFCAGADLGGFAADAPLTQKHFASDLFLEFFRLMPRRAKTNPILASSAASRMSIGRVMVMPMPTAGPLMAAITGFGMP